MDVKIDAHVACVTLAETLANHKGEGTSNCLIMSSKMNTTDKDLYYFSGNGAFQLLAFGKLTEEILTTIDKGKTFFLMNKMLLHKLVDEVADNIYKGKNDGE